MSTNLPTQPQPVAVPVAKAVPAARPAAQPAQPVTSPAQADADTGEEEEEYEEESGSSRFLLLNAAPSWMVSMLVHVIVLLVLALSYLSEPDKNKQTVLSVATRGEPTEVEQFEIQEMEPINVETTTAQSDVVSALTSTELPTEVMNVGVANDVEAAAISVDLVDFGAKTAPKSDLMKQVGTVAGEGLDGRGQAVRSQMVKRYGGNDASEAAVANALKWFAEHQNADGSWNFDHRGGRCQGRCTHHGTLDDCFTGATAMALLPFLGSGQTHREGKYKQSVQGGLAYLIRTMKPTGQLSQGGGSLYSHGLAAITLCEAFGMTHDKALMAPAQASLNYIVYAQDPVGGGWRYSPKQPGDTSAVGWQLMALKSGHMSYLQVPPATVAGAIKFLDSVQTNSGANYGYTGPGAGAAQSAVGLLCRMYLGWKKEHPGIEKGVEFLSNQGPSKTNMYFNYYATQVLRHYGGEKWEKWNTKLRDDLVNSQSKEGHEFGSWFMEGGDHGAERGGRLYCTSMATMILEVYYRHMPIYREAAAEDEFPL